MTANSKLTQFWCPGMKQAALEILGWISSSSSLFSLFSRHPITYLHLLPSSSSSKNRASSHPVVNYELRKVLPVLSFSFSGHAVEPHGSELLLYQTYRHRTWLIRCHSSFLISQPAVFSSLFRAFDSKVDNKKIYIRILVSSVYILVEYIPRWFLSLLLRSISPLLSVSLPRLLYSSLWVISYGRSKSHHRHFANNSGSYWLVSELLHFRSHQPRT